MIHINYKTIKSIEPQQYPFVISHVIRNSNEVDEVELCTGYRREVITVNYRGQRSVERSLVRITGNTRFRFGYSNEKPAFMLQLKVIDDSL